MKKDMNIVYRGCPKLWTVPS